jgi:hypothetical protein
MKKLIYFAAFFMITLISCSEDDPSVNTMTGFSIQQKTTLNKSTNKSKTLVNPLNGSITFTKVLIGVNNISIEQRDDISVKKPNHEIVFNGPFVFDILTGTSDPAIIPAQIEPGIYNKVKFGIDNVIPGGNSIIIKGNYKFSNISAFNFEFTTDLTHEFEVENQNGFQISEGDIKQFILYLDIESLFDGVDISNLSFDTDNVVRINIHSNIDLNTKISQNLRIAMNLEMQDDK